MRDNKDYRDTITKWSDENWDESISKHNNNIKECLDNAQILSIWTDALSDNEMTKNFFPEIFFDSYTSIHFACIGLYKYANMCTRSEFENGLRLIYFNVHPIEYSWWELDELPEGKNPWKDWEYYSKLNNIKIINRLYRQNPSFALDFTQEMNRLYKKLSASVHTKKRMFQTQQGFIKPGYQIGNFNEWLENFQNVQTYLNILLILNFYLEFKSLNRIERNKIIIKGIKSVNHQRIVRAVIRTL